MHKISLVSLEYVARCIRNELRLSLDIVREPAIVLIKWLRPKGLNVCSYVEKYAEFKN